MSAPTRPVVVLIGPPGSGKSTVAAQLAALLGTTARDSDDDVEAVAGKPIADIFIEDGEEAFRTLEREAVARALRSHGGVLALGGGAICDESTRQALTAHTVVFLDVSIGAAAPRVGFNQSRPLLLGNPRARWTELMNQRRPIYEQLATFTVATDDASPGEVARRIADLLGSYAAPGPHQEKQ